MRGNRQGGAQLSGVPCGSLPRRRRLDLPSGALEFVLSGEGDPTLLFSGAGVTLGVWGRLYPGIEAIGRTLAGNRAGAGSRRWCCRLREVEQQACEASARQALVEHVGASTYRMLAKTRLSWRTGSAWAARAPSGAVVTLHAAMMTSAGSQM